MVLILNQGPQFFDSFSLRPSRLPASIDWPDPSPLETGNLAVAQSAQWELPLRRDVLLPASHVTRPRLSDPGTSNRVMNKRRPLEVNTSIRSTTEPSSTSSLSASTRGSEPCSSSASDTDGDDLMPEPDSAIVPKTEDEEETSIEEIKRTNASTSPEIKIDTQQGAVTTTKKGRGRPRKHPSSPSTAVTKVTKGRSKTGCITCRRRKKKCDEAKPTCHNCYKNTYVCEGYYPNKLWRSGKQRSERVGKLSFTVPRGLPFLVDGIETAIDRRFLDHFVYELSQVLTLHDDTSNPFKDLLLPMATEHKGLMHSLMALSGSHIVAQEPAAALSDRQQHHFDEAISILVADITAANEKAEDHEGTLIVGDPTIAMTIVQCLICISKGQTRGEHRVHLEGARKLISDQQSKNPEFRQFIWEFFTYHDTSNSITSLTRQPVSISSPDDMSLPDFVFQSALEPRAGVLVGVVDGLYLYLKKITALRDSIRARKAAGLQPVVPYHYLSQAVAIDAAIRSWDPQQEMHSARWVTAQLFRQCTWVYLYRTIQASKPKPNLSNAVDSALEYLRVLSPQESAQCVLLLPLFILGCAAFEERQRPDLEIGFDNLQSYSNLGNIEPARQIVHKVWQMMDAGDERSWDWETIMADMGIDFLVT